MKRALLWTNPALEHQAQWAQAFAAGLQRHGWRTEMATRYAPSDLLVVWGVRRPAMIESQKEHGQVCVLERGYLGDRFQYSSVSFGGGLNGRATFRGPMTDPTRFEALFADQLQPWRPVVERGRALLIGQVDGDASLRGLDVHAFYVTATDSLKRRGWSVTFRPHPQSDRHRGPPAGPLARDLAMHDLVVTLNSNTAVESVLAGVPTIALDVGSMARPVTGHTLEGRVPTPDRLPWAHALAWCQWTKAEMADGSCWAAVGLEERVA
jgi:hypothetical protein